MANARAANVIRVDTSAQFTGNHRICGIKYVGAASGTASIKAVDTGGTVVWEHAGNVLIFDEAEINDGAGIYVTVTNSAVVYIYLAV